MTPRPKISNVKARSAHLAACTSSQRLARAANALQHELETRNDGVPVQELDEEDSLITEIKAFTSSGRMPKI